MDDSIEPAEVNLVMDDTMDPVEVYIDVDDSLNLVELVTSMVDQDNANSVQHIFLALENIKENILHQACLQGSLAVLEFVIMNKIVPEGNINKRMDIGEYKNVTPFELALYQDEVKRQVMIKLLISAGADSNMNLSVFKDCEEIYPIHIAVLTEDLDLLQLIIANGGDVNKITKPNLGNGGKIHTKLMTTQSIGVNSDCSLSLVMHCTSGSLTRKMVTFLLDSGCDPNIKLKPRDTPLYQAVSMDQCKIVELLLQHKADVNYTLNSEKPVSLLQITIKNGYFYALQLLVNAGASVNEEMRYNYRGVKTIMNLLTLAILKYLDQNEGIHIIEFLLQQGADPNAVCSREFCIPVATWVNVPTLVWFIVVAKAPRHEHRFRKILPMLAEHGANFNKPETTSGLSPLNLAMTWNLCGHTQDLVECLVCYGASGDRPDNEGKTPLITLLNGRLRQEESYKYLGVFKDRIDLLMQCTDNPEHKSQGNESAIRRCVINCHWDLLDYLLQYGTSLWGEEWFCNRINIISKGFSNRHRLWDVPQKYEKHSGRSVRYDVEDPSYPQNHLNKIYDHFFEHQMTLLFMSRAAIRKVLHMPHKECIKKLFLPHHLYDYLLPGEGRAGLPRFLIFTDFYGFFTDVLIFSLS